MAKLESSNTNILFWVILFVALGVIIYLLIQQRNTDEVIEDLSNRDRERDGDRDRDSDRDGNRDRSYGPPIIINPPPPIVPIIPIAPPVYPVRPYRPHPFHDIPSPPYHRK